MYNLIIKLLMFITVMLSVYYILTFDEYILSVLFMKWIVSSLVIVIFTLLCFLLTEFPVFSNYVMNQLIQSNN